MKSCRIHIMGASGAGVTSLGRTVAGALAIPHHDTDDYFWQPTTPPYREQRETSERLQLMREVFLPRADWVLSGSLVNWGDAIIPDFDLVVFLTTPTETRLRRLRAREATHFGADAVGPGGWRHQETADFIEWASHYDEGDREGRGLAKHLAWLAALPCPVLRLDGSRSLPELVAEVRSAIKGWSANLLEEIIVANFVTFFCPDNVRFAIMLAKEPPMTDILEGRSERVDLRMTPAAKQTLQRAAAVNNKTLTEFLLDTGLNAALDMLADRRVFQLDQKRWDAFMAALAAPPKNNPRLRKLLARKPAWEK